MTITSKCMSFTSTKIGGEYRCALTNEELPEHSHWIGCSNQSNLPGGRSDWGLVVDGGFEGIVALTPKARGLCVDDGTGTAGSNVPHNNIQPYVVTYFWKRIK